MVPDSNTPVAKVIIATINLPAAHLIMDMFKVLAEVQLKESTN